jgi:hypothetical protein
MEYQRDVLAQEVGAFAGLRGVKVEKRLELLGDLLLDLVVLGPILQRTMSASEQGKKTRTKTRATTTSTRSLVLTPRVHTPFRTTAYLCKQKSNDKHQHHLPKLPCAALRVRWCVCACAGRNRKRKIVAWEIEGNGEGELFGSGENVRRR